MEPIVHRVWLIKHSDNPLFFCGEPGQKWTSDMLRAEFFHCEDSALTYIVTNLDGRHQAVPAVIPFDEAMESRRVH